MKFSDFVEHNRLSITVRERPLSLQVSMMLRPYYASFDRCEARDGSCGLLSMSGNGDTPEAAIEDLAELHRGRLLIIGAASPDRREIQCPNAWLPE